MFLWILCWCACVCVSTRLLKYLQTTWMEIEEGVAVLHFIPILSTSIQVNDTWCQIVAKNICPVKRLKDESYLFAKKIVPFYICVDMKNMYLLGGYGVDTRRWWRFLFYFILTSCAFKRVGRQMWFKHVSGQKIPLTVIFSQQNKYESRHRRLQMVIVKVWVVGARESNHVHFW